MHKVLIIDDEPAICSSLRFALSTEYEVITYTNPIEALDFLSKNTVSVIVLDIRLGKVNGMELLIEIKKRGYPSSVIMMTAYGSIKTSVEAIKNGAFYYITKPINIADFQALVKRGAEVAELHNTINSLDQEINQRYSINGVVGKSKAIQEVLNLVEKVKDIDSNVLITGESGTGKELIARAIHFSGKRQNAPFQAVNCAAIPFNLLESELFGYEKGAFTGAAKYKKGQFEIAHGGTLFLDEIGEMDLALQSKLLRVIQDKMVTPLGAESGKKTDVRIICATNRNLAELASNNKFREDLYYRLNVICINIPPLRERKEDILLLVNHFVKKHNSLQHKNVSGITEDAMRRLLNMEYKGNIRELENIIERGVALASGDKISLFDVAGPELETHESKEEQDSFIPVYFGENLKSIEEKIIRITLEKVGWKQREAAHILGITDRTLRNKIKELKLGKNDR